MPTFLHIVLFSESVQFYFAILISPNLKVNKKNLSVPYICKDMTLRCSSSYPYEIDSFLVSICRQKLYNFQHQQAIQKYRIFYFAQFISFSSLKYFRSKLERAKEGMMMLPLPYFYDQALACYKVHY